jgi:AAA family ATP:ADP antiporter
VTARTFLQLRRDEAGRTALLFTYLFLVTTSSVVTKSARDALFLARFSAARLPLADIASAVAVGVAMSVYIRAGRRVGLQGVLLGSLAAFSASSLAFWAVCRSDREPAVVATLYVWAGVFGVLLPAQVWTLANSIFTTREAKRIFSLVGSGAITGWIVGGAMTRAAAPRFGAESLLLVTGVALAACPPLVMALCRQRRPPDEWSSRPPGADAAQPRGFGDSVDMVWRSPQLRVIASVILLSALVTTLAGWQFRAIAKQSIPDTDALTGFFGTFNVWAGLLSLGTQLFLTARLLRRFGLGVALFVVPLALTAGSLGLLVWGGIGAAVMLKGSDQVLRYSIDRSTVELLYLPLPEWQTFNAKAFIDTVVWRTGDCVGALIVLGCVGVIGLTAPQVSVVALVLLLGWMVAARMAARYYVDNLRASIYEHRLDVERLSELVIDRSAADLVSSALGSGQPADILYALDHVDWRNAPVSLNAVRALLDHPSPAVRARAIAVLTSVGDREVLPRVEPLLADEDAGVRGQALVCLARLTAVDPLVRLDNLAAVGGSSVASALAAFLSQPGPTQNLDAVRVLLDAASARGDADARLEAARALSWLPSSFEPQLRSLLADRSPDVARHAMAAAAAMQAADTAPLIIARLGDPGLAADAAHALASFGERTVPALRDALADDDRDPEIRRAIPAVLLRIGSPEAEHALVENLLDGDAGVRGEVVSALNRLRQLHPERRLERDLVETVLAAEVVGHCRSYQILGRLLESGATPGATAALRTSMDRELERIFRLLKLLLPDHDLHSAYVGLGSANPAVRANAVEFLDSTLPGRLRRALLPLVDDEVSLADRVRLAGAVMGGAGAGLPDLPDADVDAALREAAAQAERQLADALSPHLDRDPRR